MNIGRTRWGVGGVGNSKHTQTHTHTHTHTHTVSPVIYRVDGASAKIGSNHDTCKRGHLLFKLMVQEHREDAVRGGGSRQCQIHTHTHRHTECPS